MNTLIENIRTCSCQPAQQTERGWERDYIFPQTFLGFQGHFPGQPILPAVVQAMIFRESIAEELAQDLKIVTMTRAKFLKMVKPETLVTAIWTLKESEGRFLCKCLLESEGERVSCFNITLTAIVG